MENQNQISNSSQANTTLFLTKIFALVSCAFVFFFNISVVFNFRYFGGYGFLVLFPNILELLIALASIALIVLNIVFLVNKSKKRIVGLITVVFDAAVSIFMFLYWFIYDIVTSIGSGYFSFPVSSFFLVFICVGLLIGYVVCYILYNKKRKNADAITQTENSGSVIENDANQVASKPADVNEKSDTNTVE